MIAVVQRVTKANVCIKGGYISGIKNGYMILLGCAKFDDEKDAQYIVKKIVGLRVFNDDDGKMNLSIKEINGSILLISQFT
ncbi:MAG: D-aminoacyl-tRNA deacylase, partial [Clostridiales bacterium]|nr:D-aminoacyl-tRNA deacylase [Clostridiales bacterium]